MNLQESLKKKSRATLAPLIEEPLLELTDHGNRRHPIMLKWLRDNLVFKIHRYGLWINNVINKVEIPFRRLSCSKVIFRENEGGGGAGRNKNFPQLWENKVYKMPTELI